MMVPLAIGKRLFRRISLAALFLALTVNGSVQGGEIEPRLGQEVLALLKAKCVKCHGPAVRKGELNLATARGLARGGENGAVVTPGHLDESPLWEAVASDTRPPKSPLAEDEKTLIRRWIESGASGLPKVESNGSAEADHWAYAPATRPRVPSVQDPSRTRNDIDRFLQAALESRGLGLGSEADRSTLIRRVSLDLTGLPPTPEEISRFLADGSPNAYGRMIEHYLGSPRYAERWGKLWLDAVGYADSNGYFNADTDRPFAYRYRDYVIQSWQEDRPLDRFIREQIAGDELAGYRPGKAVDRAMAEGLIATHFLRNAPDGTGESDGNPDELRADRYAVLEGTAQVIGTAFLGMTLQCARCHDHKFEPISQKDYYSLYAILTPAYDVEEWLKPAERVIDGPGEPGELDAWEARCRRVDSDIADLKAAAAFKNPFKSIEGEEWKSLQEAIKKAEGQKGDRPGRIAFVAERSGSRREVHLLKRGIYGDPGPTVAPEPPSALRDSGDWAEPSAEPGATSGRRLAFAGWLTRPGSRPAALLARVTANRIWQGHFGVGLVATPENLGYSGSPPSNPELLEFLAFELAEQGWSAKTLHRLILNSAAYRQTSTINDSALKVDPDNLLLWRFPLRRLDAETIRDAMLAASGELDLRTGGPYVPTQRNEEGEIVVDPKSEGALRRSVYLQQRRTQVLSLLGVFDAPSIVTTCTRRGASTIPLQSLSLLNSRFVVDRAKAFAERVRREAGPSLEARLDRAFLLTTGRPATQSEQAAARAFLSDQPSRYTGQTDAEDRVWVDLCHMLLCGNAFLYGS